MQPFTLEHALSVAHNAVLNMTSDSQRPGNTYKNYFEKTSMTSGLYYVVFINIATAWLGMLFYQHVIHKQVGLLTPEELALLQKYPPIRTAQSYTPEETFVRSAPPMRFTGWRGFLTDGDASLSRDAQVYLLFQRACMATTALCGVVACFLLLPAYFSGHALTNGEHPSEGPLVLLARLLKSDRGVFERSTSHNLPSNSPLLLLQIPVVGVMAICIVILYALIHAAAGEQQTVEEWLEQPTRSRENDKSQEPRRAGSWTLAMESSAAAAVQSASAPAGFDAQHASSSRNRSLSPPPSSQLPIAGGRYGNKNTTAPYAPVRARNPDAGFGPVSPRSGVRRPHGWTLFARGIPRDIASRADLTNLLCAIYPGEVVNVEAVCRGLMSEVRLLRALSIAQNRLDYLHDSPDESIGDLPAVPPKRRRFESDSDDGLGSTFETFRKMLWNKILHRLFGRRRSRSEQIEKLSAEIDRLREGLASRRAEPMRGFLGCAFITVRTQEAARSLIYDFPLGRPRPKGTGERDAFLVPEFAGSGYGMRSTRDAFSQFLRFDNLYRALVMLLPGFLRDAVFSSPTLSPRIVSEDAACQEVLLGSATGVSSSRRATSVRASAVWRLRSMKAERAPKSGDIIWTNVGISFLERTIREMMVQLFVFLFLILFTSPVAMLTALKLIVAEVALLGDAGFSGGSNSTSLGGLFSNNKNATLIPTEVRFSTNLSSLTALPNLSGPDNAANDISVALMNKLPDVLSKNAVLRSLLLAYAPVAMLAVIFSLVPSILRAFSSLEGYSTRSARELSVFRKTSFYYVMNSVVLPSLMLNTASEFLEMLYRRSDGGSHVYNALPILQSLFSGDIAFFLCCYLVQLALTGSVIWLMRPPSSFSMMLRSRLALTPLDSAEAKCTSAFDYPRHYAYSVTVMAMCLLFGVMAPVIWIFGFMYFTCKYLVDTFVIRYVHPRSHMDGRLPRHGMTFILIWTAVSQLSVGVMFYLQDRVAAWLVTAAICGITFISCLSFGSRLGGRLFMFMPSLHDVFTRILESSVLAHGRGSDASKAFGQGTSVGSSSTGSLASDNTENDTLLGPPRQPRRVTSLASARLPLGSFSSLDQPGVAGDARHMHMDADYMMDDFGPEASIYDGMEDDPLGHLSTRSYGTWDSRNRN